MSERERWVIYPLLFLTMGAAPRDKLVPPETIKVREVECETVRIKDSQNQTKVLLHTLGSGPTTGELAVFGPDNRQPIAVIGRNLVLQRLAMQRILRDLEKDRKKASETKKDENKGDDEAEETKSQLESDRASPKNGDN